MPDACLLVDCTELVSYAYSTEVGSAYEKDPVLAQQWLVVVYLGYTGYRAVAHYISNNSDKPMAARKRHVRYKYNMWTNIVPHPCDPRRQSDAPSVWGDIIWSREYYTARWPAPDTREHREGWPFPSDTIRSMALDIIRTDSFFRIR